jgi:hypothetical protein
MAKAIKKTAPAEVTQTTEVTTVATNVPVTQTMADLRNLAQSEFVEIGGESYHEFKAGETVNFIVTGTKVSTWEKNGKEVSKEVVQMIDENGNTVLGSDAKLFNTIKREIEKGLTYPVAIRVYWDGDMKKADLGEYRNLRIFMAAKKV